MFRQQQQQIAVQLKKEKKKTLLTDHICQSRDSTGGNGNSLDGCCDNNNKKSFSNDFKSRGDAHTFFRCKRLTSKEKSAKVCKACHSSEKKTTKHTHKRECLRQMTPTYLGHTTNRIFIVNLCKSHYFICFIIIISIPQILWPTQQHILSR